MQCSYILKYGSQCKRRINSGTHCWQHNDEQKLDYSSLITEFFNLYKNDGQKMESEALRFINQLLVSLYHSIKTSNFDELTNLIQNTSSKKSYLKKSMLKLSDDLETSKYQILQTLVEYLIRALVNYTKKNITYKDINYVIGNNSELLPWFGNYTIPVRYLSRLDQKILPIGDILSIFKKYKIRIPEDALYFIQNYIVSNFLELSSEDKDECHFSHQIDEFFIQWFKFIIPKFMQFTHKLTYKETVELILSTDLFMECQQIREKLYAELLGSQITSDVIENILGKYVY